MLFVRLRRFALFVFLVSPLAAELFRDGDRWIIVGDSITHNGSYHAWVQAYYATRFPELQLDINNAGIAGDTAAGAVRRHDWDIAPKAGTVATLMLGMNDVSRSLYGEQPASPDIERRRAEALARYRKNLDELVRLLRADGVRVILLTPSPFDQTATLDAPNLPGVNDALAACSDFARHLAAADPDLSLIDLHAPLTELNLRLQKTDPVFTLVGLDRVHLGAPGHLLIAYHILKAQSAPAEVAHVALAADTLQITEARNATVTGLTRQPEDRLAFTVRTRALPYPIDPAARPALEWVPLIDELNRETLQITGLAPGDYTLAIDGQPILTATDAQLADGINLATESTTPQNLQAARVLDLVKRRRSLEASGLRTLAQVEHGLLQSLPHPVSLEAARVPIEAKIAELRSGNAPRAGYYIGLYEGYLTMKPREAEIRTELDRLAVEIRFTARPATRDYVLSPRPQTP